MSVVDGPLTGLVRTAPPAVSPDRDELAATVRALLTRHRPEPESAQDAPGRFDEGLWKRLTDVGVAGLAVPEDLGGSGGDYLDLHAVLVELGREVVATPLPATAVATQALLAATNTPVIKESEPAGAAACGRSGPAAGSDSLITGVVVGGAALVRGGFRAREDDGGRDGGWRLDGAAEAVVDGARAGVVLVQAATAEGAALFVVDGPIEREVRATMDRTLHLAAVSGTDVPARLLGPVAPARITALEQVVATAAMIGGARRALELTVEYARTRVQFGRPIGSFQAVKHRLADLLVLVEAAESASWAAAAAWTAHAPDSALLARVAAAYCGEAYRTVAAEAVQLHGGIGITWEHAAHRYLKDAHTLTTLAGTPEQHRVHLAHHLAHRIEEER